MRRISPNRKDHTKGQKDASLFNWHIPTDSFRMDATLSHLFGIDSVFDVR